MPAFCNSTNSDVQEDTSFWSGGEIVWDAHRIGWVVCGASAAVTVIVSLVSILLHATHYQSPRLQRQTIRILLMPPVYAVVSFFSYRYFREYTYYSVSETTYEAITLSAFLLLMVGMVGARHEQTKRERLGGMTAGDDDGGMDSSRPIYNGQDRKLAPPYASPLTSNSDLTDLKSASGTKQRSKEARDREAERQAVLEVMREKEKRKLPFPFNFWRFRPSKPYFMYSLKWSVLQYVILRPLISIIAIICEYYNVLCPQEYSIHFAEVYLDAVDFVSISVALYGLIIFYMVTRSELQGRKPLAKFLAIKLIVFFTFYQTWLFGILQDHGVIKGTATWTATNVTDGLSALCTSIEMIVFSVYMLWAYSYKEFVDPALTPQRKTGWKTFCMAFVDTVNLWDMLSEVGKSFRFFWRWLRRAPGTRAGEKDERTEFDQVFVPDHAPSAYAYDANHPGGQSDGYYGNGQQRRQQDPYAYPPSGGGYSPAQDPFRGGDERSSTGGGGGYSNSPLPHSASGISSPTKSSFPIARPFPANRTGSGSGSGSGNSQSLREVIAGGVGGGGGMRADSYSRLGGGAGRESEDDPRDGGAGGGVGGRRADLPLGWDRDSGRTTMPFPAPTATSSPQRRGYDPSPYNNDNDTSAPLQPPPVRRQEPSRRDSWNPPIVPPIGTDANDVGAGAGHYQRRRDV